MSKRTRLIATAHAAALTKLKYGFSGKHRHTAVAFAGSRPVSIGFNDYGKSHPQQRRFAAAAGQPARSFLHAEIAALIEAKGKADTLVVVRVNKHGELMDSTPCPVCRIAMESHGIKLVYHS